MSGHSKWSTIKRQKGANDAKRGAIFTKIGNQIAIAARNGTDPNINSALSLAIDKAKAANMPAANIQRAIDRVADKSAAALEEVVYEAYGPGGVGLIIEAATDNKNRTFPEVRTALTKHGGTMAEPGSVSFQFARKGVIRAEINQNQDADELLLIALDAGAEDAVEEENELTIYTDMKNLHRIRQEIAAKGLHVIDAGLEYVPAAPVEVSDPTVAGKIMNLLEAVDDLYDVQAVHTNADITADVE
jgi:YebC/PmpR family DNA-binding regulatory protein